MERFRAWFAELVDPRTGNAQRHELDEILIIALVATLCGAETCVDMALLGRSKEPLLRRFVSLPGEIPSHRSAAADRSDPEGAAAGRPRRDTYSRLFRLLDPVAFEACFARYVAALAERVEGVVALDGETARRSFDRRGGRGPLHLISAWACEQRLVLGQLRVDGQSNEIPAVPELLAMLSLEGCIVTADAMRCQKATARAVLARGGDYVLALKANQPALHDDVRLLLDDPAAPPDDAATTVDGDHGLKHLRTRPYSPRTNGKAERFIQTTLREWAYCRPYAASQDRTDQLRPWIHVHDHHRPRSAIGDRPPSSRTPMSNPHRNDS
jgi:transposase InsO family protein